MKFVMKFQIEETMKNCASKSAASQKETGDTRREEL